MFISLIPVFLRHKDDTVLQKMTDALAVVALRVTAVVPGHLHGDAATYIVCNMYRMPSTPNSHFS